MVKDKMLEVYNALIADEYILSQCSDRIKFYVYPEMGDTSRPFMTIEPLDVPISSTHASNKDLTLEFTYQIDVQGEDRMTVKEIQAKVKAIMNNNGFTQLANGLDTYFKETKRYVDARRYKGNTKIYDTNY